MTNFQYPMVVRAHGALSSDFQAVAASIGHW
jgi:hypothetical protein